MPDKYIEVQEYFEEKPNGDRATRNSPSSRFEIVLFNGKKKKTLKTEDQFNVFHCAISGTREEYLKDCMDYAKSIGEMMEIPVMYASFRPKHTVTWERS